MRIFTSLILLVLFISCNENNKSKDELYSGEKKEGIENIETKKAGRTTVGGIWLNKKYRDKLMATKSPKKSQDVTPMTMLVLPEDLNKEATIIWEFHEGARAKIERKNDGLEIKFPEGSEAPILLKLEEGTIKTPTDAFIKLATPKTNNDYQVVEQLLFAGKYDWKGKLVEFTANGKVIGLDDFSFYSVPIDYYDAGMQVDQLRLGQSAEMSNLYGFDFNKDKLTIYELKCAKPEADYCAVVKKGKKIYELTKQ